MFKSWKSSLRVVLHNEVEQNCIEKPSNWLKTYNRQCELARPSDGCSAAICLFPWRDCFVAITPRNDECPHGDWAESKSKYIGTLISWRFNVQYSRFLEQRKKLLPLARPVPLFSGRKRWLRQRRRRKGFEALQSTSYSIKLTISNKQC